MPEFRAARCEGRLHWHRVGKRAPAGVAGNSGPLLLGLTAGRLAFTLRTIRAENRIMATLWRGNVFFAQHRYVLFVRTLRAVVPSRAGRATPQALSPLHGRRHSRRGSVFL